jgi:glycosyltransferase involved in cell wall biosynthesis
MLAVWLVVACAAWCLIHLETIAAAFGLRVLALEAPPPPPRWPRLSIVIPACNEADTLEQALTTLRAQTYPELEIILVDDRSTDGTGAIIDRLAAADPRIRAVHITSLPDGWLGKVHALEVGTRAATGELLLYTDADVHFAPGALELAVALVEHERLDHLSLLPDARAEGFFEDTLLAVFGALFLRITRAASVGRAGSDAYAGVGAFNLVRRSAFERTEGFRWLRMEVVDDVGLGLLMQRSGARAAFLIGHGVIALRWYPGVAAMARGFEKNMFGFTARWSYARMALGVAATWLMIPAPFVALFSHEPLLFALGASCFVTLACSAMLLGRRAGRRVGPLLLFPLGQLVASLLILRSAIACWRHHGVIWRGTAYPLEALRSGQRVRI